MMNNIKAYFSAFESSNSYWNTHVSYDDHAIYFSSIAGEKFNLKFKSHIDQVFAIANGILIKLIHSSENFNFDFFKNKNQQLKEDMNMAGNSNSTCNTNVHYSYYIINGHPLNCISNLNVITNENILSINIIKASIRFPIVIAKGEGNKLRVFFLLFKKYDTLSDFNNHLQKIMNCNVDPFNISNDNYNVFPSENLFSLLFLSDFAIDGEITMEKIKIFTIFTSRHSVYFTIYRKKDLKLFLCSLKFKKNDMFSFVKNIECIESVRNFFLLDSILCKEDKDEEAFEEWEGREKNKNMMISILHEKNIHWIKNKTICYMDNLSGKFYFCEAENILFGINMSPSIPLKDFKLKKMSRYSLIYLDGHISEVRASFNLCDDYTVSYLKYLKRKCPREIYFSLLHDIFEFLFIEERDLCNPAAYFEIFSDYLCLVFCISFQLTINCEEDMQYSDDINKYGNIFPLLTSNFDFDAFLEVNYFNDRLFYSKYKSRVNSKIIEYSTINRDDLIYSLFEFTRLLYENEKIKNFYSSQSKLLAKLLVKLLKIYNNRKLVFKYISFLMLNYFIDIPISNLEYELDLNDSIEQNTVPSSLSHLKSLANGREKNEIMSVFFNDLRHIQEILADLSDIKTSLNTRKRNSSWSGLNSSENEYNLFTRKDSKEDPIFVTTENSNFLLTMLRSQMDINSIKKLHPEIAFAILSQMSKYKSNPYPLLVQEKQTDLLILNLVDRLDLSRNILGDNYHTYLSGSGMKENSLDNITSILYKNESSNYESDFYLTNIIFNKDSRIKEAYRILSPTRIIKIETNSLNLITDSTRIEIEKFNLMLKNFIRQFSACVGNGAIHLNTIKTFPKEVLNIKSLNFSCMFSSDESTYKLDLNSELLKEKDFSKWAEFHNGVSQGLKLSTEYFTNKSYIRNWILFNKPNSANFEHGGFLFAMGLIKQLDSLYSTDVYQYMKTAHDGITIGILLGRSASKISTMDESLSRTLCLHIAYLIPSTLEINIPMNIQCAASVGLGLLYLGTGNRLMTEMLLNQIGRKFTSEKSINISYVDSYNLCLGFAIGLINLGMGRANITEDLKLEEKLLSYANGGKKLDSNFKKYSQCDSSGINSQVMGRLNCQMPNKSPIHTFVEEYEVNVKLTAPAAYSCLSIVYLQSKNSQVANGIKIPENLFQLSSFRPFHLYLAILAKNLILWDNITPSEHWIECQIPSFIKFLYEQKLSVISEDMTYSYQINQIEFSQISTCYFYSISSAVMSIGFKYIGTNNKEISQLINRVIDKIRKMPVVSDIIVRDHTKYNDSNKFCLNKTTLDICLCICAYAVSFVMAGSGDLDTFKLLRVLRKKLDTEYKNFGYGYSQAINHAIGILFLGSGGLSFNSSKKSLCLLYISTFPVFASSPNDNDKYLQALRHLYVLSCENKILETRDIDTGLIIRANLNIHFTDGTVQEVITPINLDNQNNISHFSLKKDKDNQLHYYYIEIKKDDLFNNKLTNQSNSDELKTKIIFIKRKIQFDEEIEKNIKYLNGVQINSSQMFSSLVKDFESDLKKFIQSKANKRDDVVIITNIMREQISNWQKVMGGLTSDFDRIFIKSCIVFLVKYIQRDDIHSLAIINDKMMKLKIMMIEKAMDFETYEFFLNLSSIQRINQYIDYEEKLCYKEISDHLEIFAYESQKCQLIQFIQKCLIGAEIINQNAIKLDMLCQCLIMMKIHDIGLYDISILRKLFTLFYDHRFLKNEFCQLMQFIDNDYKFITSSTSFEIKDNEILIQAKNLIFQVFNGQNNSTSSKKISMIALLFKLLTEII